MKGLLDKASIYIDRAMFGYVVLVVSYQVLSLAFPIAFVSSLLHLNRVSQALAIVGFALFLVDAVTTRRFLDKRYGLVLTFVIGVLVVSSLLLPSLGVFGNGKEPSLIANVKSIIWQVDQMLVIFPYCATLDHSKFKKLLRILYWVMSVIYVPCLIVSFWQYGQSLGYDAVYGTSTGTRQGFQEGRLFGLMMGVFSAGLISLVLSYASFFFAAKEESKFLRIVYAFFALVYFLYSVLTGTRSLFVAFAVSLFVAVFMYLLKRRKSRGTRSVVLPAVLAFALSGVAASVYLGVGALMSQIPAHNSEIAAARAVVAEVHGESETCVLYHPEQETTDSAYPIIAVYLDGKLMLSYVGGSNNPFNENSLSYFEGVDDAELVRMDELKADGGSVVAQRLDVGDSAEVSNGRIAIWSDYLSVTFSSLKNILIGLSPGYYMPTVYDQYQGTDLYIVKTIEEKHPNMIANGLIYDIHNAYLSILVQSGIVGCVLVALFLFRLISDACRVYLRNDHTGFGLLAVMSIIALIMTAVFFDSDLFFRTTSTSVVFWVLCGFAVSEIRRMDSPSDEACPESEVPALS